MYPEFASSESKNECTRTKNFFPPYLRLAIGWWPLGFILLDALDDAVCQSSTKSIAGNTILNCFGLARPKNQWFTQGDPPKLDGVGPLITDPPPKSSNTLIQKKYIYWDMWHMTQHMTCDAWHVTCDMWHVASDNDMWRHDKWHMVGGEYSVKSSAP